MGLSTYILCIDTSTHVCSVCISCNGLLITIRETSDFRSHTEKITIFIQECISEARLSLKDLSAVAIASGPGSYTGLRIGASTAKGLCFGLDIPLISINSLEALSYGVPTIESSQDIILAAIDARRQEVYAMVLDSCLNVLEGTMSVILDEQNIVSQKYNTQTIHCIGNGADKCKKFLQNNVIIHGEESSSQHMVKAAYNKWQASDLNDIVSFSPQYFKNPNITLTKKKLL